MPEHPTDAHFSFTFVFKQALNVVLKLFLIIPEIFGYIEVPIILFAPMKWRE